MADDHSTPPRGKRPKHADFRDPRIARLFLGPPPTVPPITPEEFREIRYLFGSRERAAEACGVNVKQIRRWESGVSRIPRSAYHLLRILTGRDLGELARSWAGWIVQQDSLISPEGWSVTPGDLRAAPYGVRAAQEREHQAAERAEQLEVESQQLRDALQKFKDAKPARQPCATTSRKRQKRPVGTTMSEKPSRYMPLDLETRAAILKVYEDILTALPKIEGEPWAREAIRRETLLKKHAILNDDLEAQGLLGVVGLKRDHIHQVWPPE